MILPKKKDIGAAVWKDKVTTPIFQTVASMSDKITPLN